LDDVRAQQVDAALVRLAAMLEVHARGYVGQILERLPVGRDGRDLAAQERIELLDWKDVSHVGAARIAWHAKAAAVRVAS